LNARLVSRPGRAPQPGARQRARDADVALVKGEVLGAVARHPDDGKESFSVSGLPTTFGNPVWKNIRPGVLVDRGAGLRDRNNRQLETLAHAGVECT